MPITLANTGADRLVVPAPARTAFAAYARRVLAGEGVRRVDVAVVFGDDATLRSLNARYRGIDRATDVLSFTYADDGAGAPRRSLEGELVLSAQRIAAQAPRYRHSEGAELVRLVTHGLLHLCGHDHVKAGERRVMRAADRAAIGAMSVAERRAFDAVAKAARP